MTIKEIISNLGVDVTTLTKRQQALIAAWGDCDIRFHRTGKSDGLLKRSYQLSDVTLSELRRILADYIDVRSAPCSTYVIYEGQ